MHRALATWLTEHPWRAVIAIAFCGALSQLMLPFIVLACAIPVLIVLRFDAGRALWPDPGFFMQWGLSQYF